jgi:tRNA 2-thiocytidine biosynthesis protein TtcA
VTRSRDRQFRLIRPLVFVSEEITSAYAAARGVPLVPCGCSQKTGTVRRTLRDLFAELRAQHPHIQENMLAAMGNLEPQRLLDPRYLEDARPAAQPLFPLVADR